MATPRLIPDHECKQGKCGATTTGCWDQCSLKQFPVNFVGLAFPVAPLIPTEQQPANEESEADCALIQRLGGLLAEIAIIMKGPEPARTRWSYADLPELVAVMAVELDMYRTVYGTTFPEGWGAPPAVTARPWQAAPVEQASAEPKTHRDARIAAYTCPAGCGCLWRDNRDGTMSLFDGEQKSCATCEPMPLADLEPMAIADHLFIDQRDDGIWMVCVEKVHKSEDAARLACRRWKRAYGAAAALASIPPLQAPAAPESVRDVARQIATGYEGGTLATDPTQLGATIHLHYESPAEAENAFCALSDLIDAAIAAKGKAP